MSLPEIFLRVLLVTAALTALCVLGIFLMRYARRGGKGFKAAGAMLMLFGWGNMRDPNNDTVAEAQDGRIRNGESSGDPLDR
jgi:hypothetical protein